MAGIPQSVKDAAVKADKTIEALNAPATPEATPQAAPAPDAIPLAPPPPAPVTPPAENTVPTALQPPPAPAAVPTPAAPNVEFQTLQHSHDVLKGKYNAEVPALNLELTKATQENIALREQLLKASQAPAPAAPATPAAPVVPVRPDLVAMYGQDLVDTLGEDGVMKLFENQQRMNQASQQANEERMAAMQLDIDSRAQGGGQEVGQVFDMLVTQQVPDFNALDKDPAFNAWLAFPLAAFSPITRKQALQQSWDARDLGNLSAIVDAYRTETAQPAPNAVTTVPLEEQVVPGGNGTVPAAPAPAKKIYTVAEHTRISTDIALGKYTPEDKILWEQELNLAQAENRIRY